MPALDRHYLYNDANLQGYWKLDGDYADSSINGYDLTVSGSPTDVAGKFSLGKDFVRSSSQYASVAGANLRVATSQSFGGWIKFDSISLDMRIMGVADSTPTNYIDLLLVSSTNKISFQGTGLSTDAQTTTIITAGGLYFIVGVYDSVNGRIKIYVNGKEETDNAVTGTHTAGTGDFALGRMGAYNADYFDGVLDDCFFFNKALTSTEIQSLFNNSGYKINNYQFVSAKSGISVAEKIR